MGRGRRVKERIVDRSVTGSRIVRGLLVRENGQLAVVNAPGGSLCFSRCQCMIKFEIRMSIVLFRLLPSSRVYSGQQLQQVYAYVTGFGSPLAAYGSRLSIA